MTTYTALCEREGDWWVITVPELEAGGVTQARTLDEVPATVADLVALMTDADPASVEVDMKVHAGPGLVPWGRCCPRARRVEASAGSLPAR